ncbi:hypothetical protein N9L92_02500 [Saprospiraceae bacterium]|nr:hypothetical protein [Saprospiraceae bacterium]
MIIKQMSNLFSCLFISLIIISQFSCGSDDPPIIEDTFISISNDIDSPTTWTNQNDDPNDVDYKVLRSIDVNDVLTIEPGVRIEFESGVLMEVRDGALIAIGTAVDRIVFTGCESIKGFWSGILFRSDDIRNEMDFCDVSFGGDDELDANISVDDFAGTEAILKLTNSVISNSLTNGLLVDDDATLSSFSNNVFSDNNGTPVVTSANSVHQIDAISDFSDNNGFNGVEIMESTLTTNVAVSWVKLGNESQYLISGDCELEAGLTIEAGCVFIMEPSVFFGVKRDGGYLIAEGTPTDRIVFDGLINDQPSWLGILFRSDDVRNILNYCTINAGGSDELSGNRTNISVDDFAGVAAVVTIQNCEITGSGGCGIFVDSDAELIESNNVFANNVSDDICM